MECSICLTDISENGQRLTCGHTFHLVCIVQWVSRPGCRTCPLCRQQINHFLLIPNYHQIQTEETVRARFQRNVEIEFITDATFPMNLELAIWIMKIFHLRNWMPPDWISYYQERPHSSQTYEAYRLLQNGQARGLLSSVGGRPPRRLYLCRECRNNVYSGFRTLQIHLFTFHS